MTREEACCLYCKYGTVQTWGIECKNEESLYFETFRHKNEKCPEFKREERKK